MKKFLIFALAVSSYAASASVLLWMVDPSETSVTKLGDWDTAKVSYGKSDVYTQGSQTLLNIGGQNVAASSWDTDLTSTQLANINTAYGHALADLANVTDSNSQYYFIELYNGDKLVGYTATGVSGSDLSTYIKEWSDLSNMTQSMTGWGGAPFTAVPEPTSGMLMLLGMALLGLRRKKAV